MTPQTHYLGDIRNTILLSEPGNCPPRGNIYDPEAPGIHRPTAHAIREVTRVLPAAQALGWPYECLAFCETSAGLNSLVMLVDPDQRIGTVRPDRIELYWPRLPNHRPHNFRLWNSSKRAIYARIQEQLGGAA